MIILSILLIALLLLASAVVVHYVFKPKWAWLNQVILATAALAFIFGITAIVADTCCDSDISALRAEYEHINLYYNTINESNNEYVRFDFYQRVQDYNVCYMDLQDKTNSAWVGVFYPKEWDSEISLIDFRLRTGSEDGIYDYEDFYGGEVPEEDAAG